jgi:hypothetical protein
MLSRKLNKLTDVASVFLTPQNSTHRQYEALRAHFVDGVPCTEAARRFGYTPGSFRVLVHDLRADPRRRFFLPPARGPQKAPKRDRVRNQVIRLRKQNLSVYDISQYLARDDIAISPVSVSKILKAEGFGRLPRRRDHERPPHLHPTVADVADVRQLDLSPRQFRTAFGGLFIFLPYLVEMRADRLFNGLDLPGSKMIPATQAMLSLLGLKLYGSARHSHVMSDVLDEGLGLFAGLNVIPKRSFLTEYSCRIDPEVYPRLMRRWFEVVRPLGLSHGNSFDLDFHTIPFHGEDALMQKHYVSKRSRRQKGLLAFVAQDASTRVFCYANAQIRKEDQADEILQFVAYWKARTGSVPEELIFDSKLTTYPNLNHLNRMGVRFITLRRRSRKMVQAIAREPLSAWRQIEIEGVGRIYRTPRILDRTIELSGYEGPLRQMVITDLGHEDPTLLITNQLRAAAPALVKRYAQRMLIENGIADGIDFFHMDALSSAVAMKVNCDLQLTLMASSLYRLLAAQLGNGYQTAKSRHIFRDLIKASAGVIIGKNDILVRFQKRAHNPILISAGFHLKEVRVPWLGRKKLVLMFG